MDQGMMCFAMTNTSPFVAPTRALPGGYEAGGGTVRLALQCPFMAQN